MSITDDTLFTDEWAARAGDPATSLAATAISARGQKDVKTRILEILSGGPATDDELVDLYIIGGGKRTPQRVRTARAELVRAGRVRVVGVGRSYAGLDSQLWEAVG